MSTIEWDVVSDFHKEARGYRPTNAFYEGWKASTEEEKDWLWQMLTDEVEMQIREQKRAEKQAVIDFEEDIQAIIEAGAGDRTTALRWMTQDSKFWHQQSVEHWVWELGILFTDYGRELVKELMDIVTFEEWDLT